MYAYIFNVKLELSYLLKGDDQQFFNCNLVPKNEAYIQNLTAFYSSVFLESKFFDAVKFSQIFYRVFIKYCVFFSKILKHSGLLPFSVFPRCQCVYTHQAGRTPALRQSSEKFRNF